MQKNDIISLAITGYASDGAGVSRHDGLVVFTRGAIAGETISARILKVSQSVAHARVESVLTASPERITPECPAYPRCGGCDFQHMSYAEELRAKHERVNDALTRLGDTEIAVPPVVPSPSVTRYRNKAIFEVGSVDGRAVTGFYRAHSHDIVAADDCPLQSETAVAAARVLRGWIDAHDIKGIRNLMVRTGSLGAQIVIVASRRLRGTDALVDALRETLPDVKSIVLCTNSDDTNVVLRGEFRTLYGGAEFADTLCGNEFRLSPQSFYQVNHAQAEQLYAAVRDFAALTESDTALDLYCGAGTITLALAASARTVYGAEIVPEAVVNARENAARNGVQNAEFLLGDAGDAAKTLSERGVTPDVVVVDPPRKGLSPETLAIVAETAKRAIVYVSCDPSTFARDVKLLRERGWRLAQVRAFDMFPRTSHVECVGAFARG
ncbi:MAG: 23S rRNA (uracil(1939)-C(5))-methyltransferase RlmD [Oscillospiraceae bacterium]|jgi:23S rRNA (uracil1939-C5)-methyltransferase|nr:23S rRNA (uracil(1939)-C(5))-methyltransferase RlmD [Oscillospiraceae bacterium]